MSIMQKMLGVAFAMVLVTGCSSQQSDKDSDSSTDKDGLSGSSTTGAGERDGNWGSVSDQYGNVVYFEFDSSDIQPASEEMLNAYSKLLKQSGAHATLEGNTDERGTREYNMALGERRGKAVADYLTMQGVSSSQLEVVSFGEERPAVDGDGESAYSKNRRVEIIKK
ncbi:MAG TPA: peptidoglycan-associated lipoprotein Pal [Pseudomonadales bacterium]|nr:peptidoglycan-associated lipoprotein Pal [Pseudomonadales bacterium]